jgi:hypothetical protein
MGSPPPADIALIMSYGYTREEAEWIEDKIGAIGMSTVGFRALYGAGALREPGDLPISNRWEREVFEPTGRKIADALVKINEEQEAAHKKERDLGHFHPIIPPTAISWIAKAIANELLHDEDGNRLDILYKKQMVDDWMKTDDPRDPGEAQA